MKYYNHIVLFFFLLLSATMLHAQKTGLEQAKEILSKVKNAYDQTAVYRTDVKYTMYKGPEHNEIMETYEGIMVRDNGSFYSKIHQTETLQLTDKVIKINHLEKALSYHLIKNNEKQQRIMDLDALLQYFTQAKVEEIDGNYKITLLPPKISQSPYGLAILTIEKEQMHLMNQTLIFANKMAVKFNDGSTKEINPRLEVIFSNFSKDIKQYKSKFLASAYIKLSSQGARPAQAFKDYQLIDLKDKK